MAEMAHGSSALDGVHLMTLTQAADCNRARRGGAVVAYVCMRLSQPFVSMLSRRLVTWPCTLPPFKPHACCPCVNAAFFQCSCRPCPALPRTLNHNLEPSSPSPQNHA